MCWFQIGYFNAIFHLYGRTGKSPEKTTLSQFILVAFISFREHRQSIFILLLNSTHGISRLVDLPSAHPQTRHRVNKVLIKPSAILKSIHLFLVSRLFTWGLNQVVHLWMLLRLIDCDYLCRGCDWYLDYLDYLGAELSWK